MRSPDHARRGSVRHLARRAVVGLMLVAVIPPLVAQSSDSGNAAAESAYRFRAPIELQQAGAFVQLDMPASAYERSEQVELRDLRVVDAAGRRVPFALQWPRPRQPQDSEQRRDVALYPLPPRPTGAQGWPVPVELLVQGDSIRVRRMPVPAGTPAAPTTAPTTAPEPTGQRSPAAAASAAAPAASAPAVLAGPTLEPATPPPGWVFDLGDPVDGEAPATGLRLAWPGSVEFSVGYTLETSDDLRRWQRGSGGQLMQLAGPAGPLTQTLVMLPDPQRRYVRLVWSEAVAAPRLTGAQRIAAERRRVALDAPTELQFSPGAEPQGKVAPDEDSRRALHFDLGGRLPVERIHLSFAAGATRIAPVRLQGRDGIDAPWRELAQAVFYRIERGTEVSLSPPLEVDVRVRYLRVLVDERAAPPDPAATRLVVQAALPRLVFAAQGTPPYALMAGSAKAPAGALPLATLVPALEAERARFGRGLLGEWSEVPEVARQVQDEQRRAELRPWLLWAVLLGGVALLGAMVWRLARGRGGST